MRRFLASIRTRLKTRTQPSRSLLRALKELVPPRILRDVLSHSRDKRHLGALTAAWIGITEQELMIAVGRMLRLPYQSGLQIERSLPLMLSHPDLLEQLEASGAVLSDAETVPHVIACVDPTELRSVTAYDLSEFPVVLATWTSIRASLDRAFASAALQDAERDEIQQSKEDALALEAIHLIFTEIIPFEVRTADLFLGDQQPRYQFILQNGKRGVGVLHAKVAPILERFLLRVNRVERPFSVSGAIGSLKISIIAEGAVYRLIWSPVTRRVEAPPSELRALPAPTTPAAPSVVSLVQTRTENNGLHCKVPTLEPAASEPRPRVLIADDNLMFARILEKYLDKHGFSTTVVKDGTEALEWLRSTELPALLITDLHMPSMNGRELVASLRADRKFSSLKVIVLTSDEDAEAEIQLLGIGADAFIAKSKDPRVLCSHVVRLANSAPRREAA